MIPTHFVKSRVRPNLANDSVIHLRDLTMPIRSALNCRQSYRNIRKMWDTQNSLSRVMNWPMFNPIGRLQKGGFPNEQNPFIPRRDVLW